MKKLSKQLFIVGLIGLLSLISNSAQSQCGPLTTPYLDNNGQSGIMFDVVALQSVNITQLAMDFETGSFNMEIYFVPGTHVGNETNAAAWTLLGTVNGWNATGGTNVALPIFFNQFLCAGDVGGFYVTASNSTGGNYYNGTGVGNVAAADANIQILEGTGKAYPFGTNYMPRVPNVTVYYDCATSCCLPPTMTMTPEVCFGSCDGTATAAVGAGGVSPYSYQWDDLSAQTTQTAIGLCAGTYSVDVIDNTGCISTNTVIVTSGATSSNATITPEGPFCESDAALNLSAVDPGGTWSGTGITDGLIGSFDPSVAGAGTHTITYTILGSCGDIETIDIIVSPAYNLVDNISACENTDVIYPDGTIATITVSTSYTSNLTTVSGCDSVVLTNVTMNPLPNSGNNGSIIFCATDAPSDLTNELVGPFDVGGVWLPIFNSGNNFFDPAIDPAGTYTYTVTNSCGTSTTDVIVAITVNPNTGTDGNIAVCETDPSVDLFGLLGGAPNAGGSWSPALSSGSGTYNPAVDAGGAYIYSIINSCGTFSSIVDVTLNVSDDATFSYSADVYCLNDANPLASINATNGGVFTVSSGGAINATNGTIDIAGSGPGTFGVTYSTSGPCPDVFVLTITILDVIDPTITPVGPFCSYDAPVILQVSQPGGVWSGTGVNPVTGEFNPSLAVSGLNDITYTIDGLCIAFSAIQIEVIPAPLVSTIADTIILNGTSVNLITTGNASAYSWTPGATLICDDCQNPIATPDATTTYTVSVEENGCVASDQVTITIDYEIIIYVPNAFTPNGDGKNDIFFPIINDIDPNQYKLLIFNRWGELVFESQQPSQGWDGNHKGMLAQDGAYVWKIYCKEVSTIETHEYMGHVTLIK
jgi:gliding motility-associated-like protein